MKERPVLFSGPMVRAVLDGRKTQTRRIAQLVMDGETDGNGHTTCGWEPDRRKGWGRCQPGDRLWVRETHAFGRGYDGTGELARLRGGAVPQGVRVAYRADGDTPDWAGSWRPSIHMPRWASRITLDVMAVRIERLQDIGDQDVKAEGLACWTKDGTVWKWGLAERHVSGELDAVTPWQDMERSARDAFARLWDEINSKRAPWASNPWVWVVEFKVVQP